VFEKAFATAPWTMPSHASMLTGLYPNEHRAGHASPPDPLPEEIPTLATFLRTGGYHTIAFTAGGIMSRSRGLARGFDSWTQHNRASLPSVLPAVFDELDRAPAKPIFLFLHTYDVHGPYANPESPRNAANRAETSLEEWQRILNLGPHRYQRFERFEGLHDIVAAYDAGIRKVDAALATLFTRLKELGMYDSALIIVTSDHGESLYERGVLVGHTQLMYDTVLHIPFIVRLPQGREPGRTRELMDLTDVTPLILDEVGMAVPESLSGSNPLKRIAGKLPRRALVRGEASHTGARYARSKRWKVITGAYPPKDERRRIPTAILDRFEGGAQWFDISADPEERSNLIWKLLDPPAELLSLRQQLEESRKAESKSTEAGSREPPLSEDERNQLEALGYLDGD